VDRERAADRRRAVSIDCVYVVPLHRKRPLFGAGRGSRSPGLLLSPSQDQRVTAVGYLA
jgi:hypothetical protein